MAPLGEEEGSRGGRAGMAVVGLIVVGGGAGVGDGHCGDFFLFPDGLGVRGCGFMRHCGVHGWCMLISVSDDQLVVQL